MAAPSQRCERARWWASLRADAELSELESALLDAHLGACGACRGFADGAAELAAALRSARLEPPAPRALVLPRRRAPLHALQAVLAIGVAVAAGAAASLGGVGGHSPSPARRTVAVVAATESPDAFRRLRRPLLVAPGRQPPRWRRVPAEEA